jgi:hypothetical protein
MLIEPGYALFKTASVILIGAATIATAHEHADTPHTARLLRPHREWPSRRAAEKLIAWSSGRRWHMKRREFITPFPAAIAAP